MLKENEDLKKEQFRRSQQLFALRSAERELISDISGGQGQNKNLAARIATLDEQVSSRASRHHAHVRVRTSTPVLPPTCTCMKARAHTLSLTRAGGGLGR